MARPPLIIDTPIGKLYAIDLGAGVMLMIEQDGRAETFPMDETQAKHLGQYLRPLGRPVGATSQEALQELVDIYTSDEAAAHKSRAKYTAQVLGVPEGTVFTRLKRAKTLGMITDD